MSEVGGGEGESVAPKDFSTRAIDPRIWPIGGDYVACAVPKRILGVCRGVLDDCTDAEALQHGGMGKSKNTKQCGRAKLCPTL
jgi:hypothetical protein